MKLSAKINQSLKKGKKQHQQGIGLVEVMISLLIFVIAAVGIDALFVSGDHEMQNALNFVNVQIYGMQTTNSTPAAVPNGTVSFATASPTSITSSTVSILMTPFQNQKRTSNIDAHLAWWQP